MNNKRAKSIIAVILAVLMLLGLMASLIPATAHAVTQSEINELQQQKNELSSKVQECQDRLQQLQDEEANVLEQKAALDVQNQLAEEQLQLVAQEIALYDGMISDKAEELEEARAREAEQLRRYRARVRAMEESGGYNILALIINSSSFSELLTAIDDMGEIMESDKALEEEYRAARQETEAVKAEYEEVREDYGEKQEELKAEQAALEAQIEEAKATLEELAADIEKAQKEFEEAEAAEAAAEATITQFLIQYNEQKRQEAANNGSNGGTDGGGSGLNPGAAAGTGSFIWPVPCSTRVTSRYGTRIDPITFKEGSFHAGLDIDGFGNAGSPIVAADGGTVITASYDSAYGNYVIIDHGFINGDAVQTVYAHMSGLAVSKGDTVEQGQTIGYLGDTGRATGVHCHFEVRINGSTVDPAAYFTGLTYWNC